VTARFAHPARGYLNRPRRAREALWLGVPVAVAEAVCADLEDAGLVTPARGH
jgi:hypothetical protein